MTEEEAKTKWCPFARAVTANGDAAFNRVVDPKSVSASGLQNALEATRCVGSACMAWRTMPDTMNAASGDMETNGHCGLAGQP